ncbi:murinoglobulin-1-like [Chironomus tepperi]|uniref:murinoglobulin-1-like n=1 Tax=Chironomus tepperi TaxID=113505 RepID=UPI00391FA121
MEIRFKYLFLFLSIVQLSLIVQGDEFVTLWAPKTILKSQTYSAVILPTKLQGKTEVALQFRNYNLTKQLVSGKAVRIDYPDKVKGSKTEVNLIMTLHVDEPIDKNQVASICSTKSLKIKIDNREHVTFIQTDKPIYKPGDEVKVKILVVDRDIKPFHMNNIDVDIIDPLNRTIAHFDDLDDENLGVVEFRFSLGTQTVLGDWTIQVKIDRSQRIKAVKSFSVQKFVLPSFEVFVDIPDQHVLASSQVTVSFYAKYPFGEFVTGNAELSIIGVNSKKVYLQNNFTNVDGVQKLSYKLQKDLSISNNTETEFEAVVTFTEPESKLSYKKSTNFYVHTGKRHKIVAKHPEKFLAGQAFTIKIIITDWKDQRISINSKHVNLTMEVKIEEHLNLSTISLDLLNGTADYDFMVPEGTTGLKLWIEYLNADKYEKTIEMGNVKVGIDDLEVYHVPKK